jgi:hypothetical protein
MVVQVKGEGGTGYLYFDRGRILHAITADLWRGGGAGDPRLDQRIVPTLREIDEEGSGEMPSAKTGEVTNQAGGRTEPGSEFEVVLRISPNGTLVSNRGGSEDLADTTAYVHRLTQLTGELLGLEDFVALECIFVEGRFTIFTDTTGEIVALRPRPEANLQPLRERLGL